mgnify:FL=1
MQAGELPRKFWSSLLPAISYSFRTWYELKIPDPTPHTPSKFIVIGDLDATPDPGGADTIMSLDDVVITSFLM